MNNAIFIGAMVVVLNFVFFIGLILIIGHVQFDVEQLFKILLIISAHRAIALSSANTTHDF